jgi:hypothetical protein
MKLVLQLLSALWKRSNVAFVVIETDVKLMSPSNSRPRILTSAAFVNRGEPKYFLSKKRGSDDDLTAVYLRVSEKLLAV